MGNFIKNKGKKHSNDNDLLVDKGGGIGPQEKKCQRKYQDMADQCE